MIRKAATRPAVLSLSGLLVALSVEFVESSSTAPRVPRSRSSAPGWD